MSPERSKIIVIVGPNASGKSNLAVQIAKKFSGEIISADSRQIYRGLDIGTGKVPGKWRAGHPEHVRFAQCKLREGSHGDSSAMPQNDKRKVFIYKSIPHYCIDFVSPKKTFAVAEYKKCAASAIKDVTRRGKIPLVVGGTGFWIDTLVYNLELPAVPPNPKLRKKLEKKSAAQLLIILKKLDPQRVKTIEQKNPRRLIRAIEIAKILGRAPKMKLHGQARGISVLTVKPAGLTVERNPAPKTTIYPQASPWSSGARIKKDSPYQILWLGISHPKKVLQKRIHERLLQRMQSGMINEARSLKKHGLSWKRFYELGLEYKFLADYLRGRLSKKEMLEKIERSDQQYARRQMVWFKRNKAIHWIQKPKKAHSLVKKFLA